MSHSSSSTCAYRRSACVMALLLAALASGGSGSCTAEVRTESDAEITEAAQAFSNQYAGPSSALPGTHCVAVNPFPLGRCLPVHEQITVEALAFLKRDVRNFIALSNADYDALHTTGIGSAFAHFDNCTFEQSSGRIRHRYRSAVASAMTFPSAIGCPTYFAGDCRASGDETSLEAFAAALHGVQDFYAHTNWVEAIRANGKPLALVAPGLGEFPDLSLGVPALGGDAVFIEAVQNRAFTGQWGVVPPPRNATYPASVVPRACRRGRCVAALVSGQTAGSLQTLPNLCPAQVRIMHDGELAKDGPDPVRFFDDARLLARMQTAREWCRLVSLVRQAHQQDGDWFLYDKWVENVVAARCGDDVDITAVPDVFPHPSQPIGPGSGNTYQFKVANFGAASAFGVAWEITFSGGVSLVGNGTIGGLPCRTSGQTVTCQAADTLAPASTATIEVSLTPSAPGIINATARASSHNPDTNPTNDEVSFQFIVECPSSTPKWNAAASKCEACAPGTIWSSQTQKCECNPGETWDPTSQTCVPDERTDFYVSVDDYARLVVDGQLLASYDASPWGEAWGSAALSPGWHTIQFDYANRWGSTHVSLYWKKRSATSYVLVPRSSMRSSGASGAQVQGLRADYSGGGQSFTVYGEGPIDHGWPSLYQGQTSSLWGGVFDANWGKFSETLTGEILVQ